MAIESANNMTEDLGLRWFQQEVSRLHWPAVCVDREADVDESDQDRHNIADMDGLGMITLGKIKSRIWYNLLPSQAHVCSEDTDRGDIEEAPAERLEDLKLKPINVANISCVFKLAVWLPEEVNRMCGA